MTNLLNDAEWADKIVEIFTTPEYERILEAVNADVRSFEDNQERHVRFYKNFDLSAADLRKSYEMYVKEFTTKEKNGELGKAIKEFSGVFIPPELQILKKNEIRFADHWSLNGQILINPSTKNPVIIMNKGMATVLPLLFSYYFHIIQTAEVYHTASSETKQSISFRYLYASFAFSAYILANNTAPKLEADGFVPLVPEFTPLAHYMSMLGEAFILLHEYAHIFLKHIPDDDYQADAIHLIERSLSRELSADITALSWMKKYNEENFDLCLFAYGFVMLTSETIFNMDIREEKPKFQYPEYVYRWEAIKSTFEIERYSNRLVWTLDAWFSRILTCIIHLGFLPKNPCTYEEGPAVSQAARP